MFENEIEIKTPNEIVDIVEKVVGINKIRQGKG